MQSFNQSTRFLQAIQILVVSMHSRVELIIFYKKIVTLLFMDLFFLLI